MIFPLSRSLLLAVMLAAAAAALAAAPPDATRTVHGVVVSADDRQPVAGANVFIHGTVVGTTSAADGSFVLRNVPEGSFTLVVSMVGFRRFAQNAAAGETPLVIALEPAAVQAQPVTVTASRHEQELGDAPVSVSFVDDRALEMRNTVTVDDALKYVPGVNITRGQVNVRGSTGFSYGVGSRVLLLVDGLPMLSGDTGEIIWESFPPGDIERIEIVKGAGSALYGSSALGGVVNIITKRPGDRPATETRAYGGMYDLPRYASWKWTGDARTFGGLTINHRERIGAFALDAGGSRTEDDGYKRNDFWRRWNGWARLAYDLSPFESLGLTLGILNQQRGNFLYWKDLDHALEPPDNRLDDRISSLRWSVTARWRKIAAALSVDASLRWFRSNWDDNLPVTGSPGGSNSRSDAVAGEVQGTLGSAEGHLVTAGLSGSFNGVAAEEIFGTHASRGGAGFVQDEVALAPAVRLTLGGRVDWQSMAGRDDVLEFNPKGGIVVRASDATTIRASAGRGFRAPSVAELYTTTEAGGISVVPNPSLLPERSWSFEVGATHAVGDAVTAGASIFWNELWDLIEPAFQADGRVHFGNVTHARIAGTELSLGASFFDRRLALDFSYTYVDPEDVDLHQVLKYRPRQLLYASGTLALAPFHLDADYRYLSRIEQIDEEFTLVVPGGDARIQASVVDLRAGADWEFGGVPLTVTIGAENLFQYYYTDFIGNLAPVRRFTLSLGATI